MGADSAPLRFSCPYCDQHIECDLSLAGADLKCPTCGKSILAPAARIEALPKLIEPEANKAARPIPIREQARSEPVKRAPAWVEKAANYSMVAPITGVCLGIAAAKTPMIVGMSLAILMILLIVSAGVAGAVAVFYCYRYRGKGMVRAFAGIFLSFLLLVRVILPAYERAAERYRELKQRQEMKAQRRH
jgi:hypothetical protein